jgi:hypothetical protein
MEWKQGESGMCDACENELQGAPVRRDRATLDRAREIEAGMPGNRVPEEAWAVFEGTAGGAILWAHLIRLHASYEAAEAAGPQHRAA